MFDMLGNVRELTTSRYYPSHDERTRADLPGMGFDPKQPGVPVHVIKGGSFLCAADYCARYRPAARQAQDDVLSTSHIGFRTVRDASSTAEYSQHVRPEFGLRRLQ